MGKHKVSYGQNIMDIALQRYGTIEEIFRIMDDNQELVPNINVEILSGDEINLSDPARSDDSSDIANKYSSSNIVVNTGAIGEQLRGIGAMGIEYDFIVSEDEE